MPFTEAFDNIRLIKNFSSEEKELRKFVNNKHERMMID